MKMRQFGLGLLFILTITLGISSQEANAQPNGGMGVWNGTALVDGAQQEYTWRIHKKEGKLVGHVESDSGKFTLDKIDLDDDLVTFQFQMDADGEELIIKVTGQVKGNELTGNWVAVAGGSEVDSGEVTAKRKAKKAKAKMGLAGDWDSVASLPNGDELTSMMTLDGKDNALTGSFATNDTIINFDEVKVTDGTIRMSFAIDVQDRSVGAVIEAEVKSNNELSGVWILKNEEGNEAAKGDWKATRQVKSVALFDGKSLDNFRGYADESIGEFWKVEDGVIHYVGGRCGDIVTKKEYGDFELEFEWKITEGGNSGVMYRVSLGDKKPWHTGPEYQLLDDDAHKDGADPSKSTGSLYAMYEAKGKTVKPVGEWNSTKIVLQGNRIEHWLNGSKVVEVEIGSDDWNEKYAASKFAKHERFAQNKKGHICFQDHGNEFWLRNIRIKSND